MGRDQIERRLAAILIADVVGYSRMMGEDEAATLLALQEHRFALIDPTIGQHHGRIVKSMGDGILVEFHSVQAARAGGQGAGHAPGPDRSLGRSVHRRDQAQDRQEGQGRCRRSSVLVYPVLHDSDFVRVHCSILQIPARAE